MRRYSAKETYDFKEPTNRSHPIRCQTCCRAVCCSVLQCVAVAHNWRSCERRALRESAKVSRLVAEQCVAVCCSVLQCVAVCCSVLQCVAVCCSALQCVAVAHNWRT